MPRAGFSPYGVSGTQDVEIVSWEAGTLQITGTVDITSTLDATISGTIDVDIKTLGGSVVPAGPLPVDIGVTGTVEIGSWHAGTLDVDIGAAGTLDVDIKTLGGSVVPFGKLPVNATCSTVHCDQIGTWDITGTVDISGLTGTLDVDIKTLGGSVVPAGPLPVDVESFTPGGTQDVEIVSWEAGTLDVDIVSGTLDVDIKTIGGSVVPFGKLPVNATCSTVHCDQIGTWDVDIVSSSTLDVDIKTLGGSIVPAGPLPVNIGSTGTVEIGSWEAGTLDVDIKTVGGSVVGNTIPVSGTVDISGLSGTLDVDIKTVGNEVVPQANSDNVSPSTYVVPTMSLEYGYDDNENNWDRIRLMDAWPGGTQSTPIGYQEVTLVGRYLQDTSGTLQAITVNSNGAIYTRLTGADTFSVGDNQTFTAGANVPFGSEIWGFDGTNWDRIRTTEAMVNSTIGVGLLAIGEFGYDGSAWRYKAVDSSGHTIVTGTVDVDIVSSSTLDVDIKTLGGSVVPAGPLPVDVESFTPGGTQDVEIVSWEAGTLDVDIVSGTLDVDIKTIGGSVVPFGKLPVNATCSTVHTDAVATSLSLSDDTSNTQKFWIDTANDQIFYPVMQYGYDGSDWDRIRTTQAVSGGTITKGLLATDHIVRRSSTLLIDGVVFQGTTTSACSADWNVTDFNKLGLMITLTSTGTPTDIRITAEFKDEAGTYYIYQNDFWGDMRWDDTAIGSSTIHECVMGDLPVGTLRVCAYTQGTSTTNRFSLTVKGQVYTW